MLDGAELKAVDAWFRAANYLTVGQIYLQANPLLHEPLRPEHIKPRLLGHWGTSPGINLVYAHLNRLIRERDLNAILLVGPGHGGPAVIANVWPCVPVAGLTSAITGIPCGITDPSTSIRPCPSWLA